MGPADGAAPAGSPEEITFANLPEWYDLFCSCRRCGRESRIDRRALARRFGDKQPILSLARGTAAVTDAARRRRLRLTDFSPHPALPAARSSSAIDTSASSVCASARTGATSTAGSSKAAMPWIGKSTARTPMRMLRRSHDRGMPEFGEASSSFLATRGQRGRSARRRADTNAQLAIDRPSDIGAAVH
ncbi:hypothetical protein ABIA27_004932 [Sinorhizobium fredii]